MYSIFTTSNFDKWFQSIKDQPTKRRIQARIDRAEDGNLGDCKPVGHGVSEMRVMFGAGYRLYFMQHGQQVIILLAGGSKSGQQGDMTQAIELADQIRTQGLLTPHHLGKH